MASAIVTLIIVDSRCFFEAAISTSIDTLDVKKDLNTEFGSETDNSLIVFFQTAKAESKTRVYETIWSQKLPKKAKIFSRKIILERVTLLL